MDRQRREYGLEAANCQMKIYGEVVAQTRKESGTPDALKILDFGSGACGSGRVFLQGKMKSSDELHLYDPQTKIHPAMLPNVREVREDDIIGPRKQTYDLINISYVLCYVQPDQAIEMLRELRENQPQAMLAVMDYILRFRHNEEILRLLDTDSEFHWRAKMGDEEFIKTHSRHSLASLASLLQDSGYGVRDLKVLDRYPTRAALIAKPGAAVADSRLASASFETLTKDLSKRITAMIRYASRNCRKIFSSLPEQKSAEAISLLLGQSIEASRGIYSETGDQQEISWDTCLQNDEFLRWLSHLDQKITGKIKMRERESLHSLYTQWSLQGIRSGAI